VVLSGANRNDDDDNRAKYNRRFEFWSDLVDVLLDVWPSACMIEQ